MCSGFTSPSPRQPTPLFRVVTPEAQYSARPSTSQSGQELIRGCTPTFWRI